MSTYSAGASPANEEGRSVVARAFLGLGAAVVAVGVLVTLLGLAGASAFDVAVKSFAFDSTSTGLAVIAVGGGLIAGVALDPPGDAYRYDPARASAAERAQRRLASAGIAIMATGLILYVVSILF